MRRRCLNAPTSFWEKALVYLENSSFRHDDTFLYHMMKHSFDCFNAEVRPFIKPSALLMFRIMHITTQFPLRRKMCRGIPLKCNECKNSIGYVASLSASQESMLVYVCSSDTNRSTIISGFSLSSPTQSKNLHHSDLPSKTPFIHL
jgi:hypothetical protein